MPQCTLFTNVASQLIPVLGLPREDQVTPRWFRVANGYPNKRGPTIPFLLGALREPPGRRVSDAGTCKTELRALLVAMRDETPDGHQATICPCEVIGQLIVGVGYGGPHGACAIPSPSNPARGLHVEPIYGLPVVDLDSLADELWSRYGDAILEGNFSWREKQWKEFDAQELARIAECLTLEEREEA